MKHWIFLFAFNYVTIVFAQNLQEEKKLLATDVYSVSVDPLQQIYYINKNKQLIKLSSIQDKIYVYSDLMIDQNTSIYSDNPFKVLLYKKDIGDVIILDNRLTKNSKINLFNLGYFSVSSINNAMDNQSIILFDTDRQQIIKLDQQNKEIFQSINMAQLLQKRISPIQIKEFENKLYLLDAQTGIYIFDQLGTFIKNIPIEKADNFWIISKQIYFYRDQQIWLYNSELFEEIPQYRLDDYTNISLCRDFILGITPQSELYQIYWKN